MTDYKLREQRRGQEVLYEAFESEERDGFTLEGGGDYSPCLLTS
jgi:hypothetical protein